MQFHRIVCNQENVYLPGKHLGWHEFCGRMCFLFQNGKTINYVSFQTCFHCWKPLRASYTTRNQGDSA
ncbi:hypothetical protein CW304_26195 [Bacillus sp. UFRGS-B20]|nr:hypothetical protein CW304_26195 [Bacillus sp. UFRGS-B20]